jgi:hypothetical protein
LPLWRYCFARRKPTPKPDFVPVRKFTLPSGAGIFDSANV